MSLEVFKEKGKITLFRRLISFPKKKSVFAVTSGLMESKTRAYSKCSLPRITKVGDWGKKKTALKRSSPSPSPWANSYLYYPGSHCKNSSWGIQIPIIDTAFIEHCASGTELSTFQDFCRLHSGLSHMDTCSRSHDSIHCTGEAIEVKINWG